MDISFVDLHVSCAPSALGLDCCQLSIFQGRNTSHTTDILNLIFCHRMIIIIIIVFSFFEIPEV